MRPIAIYGAGGLGKEILALLSALEDWNPVGFYDDQIRKGTTVNGLKVLGGIDQLKIDAIDKTYLIVAVGNPKVKNEIVTELKKVSGILFPTIVHPLAIIMHLPSVSIGEGTVVAAGCILTTNISVGAHVLVNINSTIGHDCSIGNYVSIMPGVNLSGGVKVGNEVLIGSGANIINGVSLKEGCTIGMGSVVLEDIEANTTAVGVPAKIIRT